MPSIIDEINRSSKFIKKPIGPIGLYINFKEGQNKWGLAVENALGKYLDSFIVDNVKDSLELQNIFRKFRAGFCTTIIQKFRDDIYRIDRNYEPDPKYTTIFRILKFENPMVANVLIDQAKIERIALAENQKLGDELSYDIGKRGNINSTFLINGDWIFKSGNSKNYVAGKVDNLKIGQDMEKQITESEKAILSKQNEEKELKEGLSRIDDSLRTESSNEKIFLEKKYRLERDINSVKNEIHEMERNIEIEQGIDIADLERNLENIQSQIKETNENLEEIVKKYNEEEQKMEPITSLLEEKNKEAHLKVEETNKYQRELEKILKNKEKVSREKAKASTHYNALIDTKNDLIKKCEEIEKVLLEDTEKAQEICDRVPVEDGTRNIITKLTTLEKRVQEEQKKKKKSSEEISKEYYEASKNFQTTNNSIKNILKTREMLEKALIQRTKYWTYMERPY